MLPRPPSSEQIAIVRFLNETTSKVEDAILHARREIKLFHEYRTRLIADVVTGKLDVRSAAAELPESMPDTDEDRNSAVGVEASFRMADEGITQEVESR